MSKAVKDPVQELIRFGQHSINQLIDDQRIRWFVDANVLQSGFVERHFKTVQQIITTGEIVSELQKRPEDAKSGLRVTAQLESRKQISTEASFGDKPESFSLLMACATQLAPSIRVRTHQIIQVESMDHDAAEEKAINQLAAEGDFFASKIKSLAEELDLANKHLKRVASSTRRSWFRHPAKRRDKIRQDNFLQSDERLLGFAAANLFLRREPTCILSNDTDFAAILKQFTDNLLWVASTIDCIISFGRAELDAVIQLWEARCRDLNIYREFCGAKQIVEIDSNEDTHNYGLLAPNSNELLVCRPQDGHSSRFAFSDKLIDFVADFRIVAARCSLSQSGFWFPRKPVSLQSIHLDDQPSN